MTEPTAAPAGAPPAAPPAGGTPPPAAAAAPPASTAPAPAAAPVKGSADPLGEPAPGTPAASPPADWPADWRIKAAGGDAELAKQLERFSSPADLAKAQREAQKKISAGFKSPTLPPNATPEQQKEYREQLGIPEKPDGYKLELGDGRVVGAEDKPFVDQIVSKLHGQNATPAEVNRAVGLYFDLQEAETTARSEADVSQRAAVEDALRRELGEEYRPHVNAVKGFLSTLPNGLGEQLRNARMPDGTAMFNAPGMLRFFMDLSKQLNPAATIVPGAAGNASGVMSTRISEIKSLMADTQSKYWEGTPDEKRQLREEYDRLHTAQGKMAA